ncbi:hypothetical protein TNCV_469211 [Trichonephila clavipes]|nr:hypothetical protein TNCV_469211 [Trichonephila clavipes]
MPATELGTEMSLRRLGNFVGIIMRGMCRSGHIRHSIQNRIMRYSWNNRLFNRYTFKSFRTIGEPRLIRRYEPTLNLSFTDRRRRNVIMSNKRHWEYFDTDYYIAWSLTKLIFFYHK